MKAVRMHGYGGVEQLFYEDADEPRLTEPTEVIVKLKAASLNHIDIWNRLGATGIVVPMPHILGRTAPESWLKSEGTLPT